MKQTQNYLPVPENGKERVVVVVCAGHLCDKRQLELIYTKMPKALNWRNIDPLGEEEKKPFNPRWNKRAL